MKCQKLVKILEHYVQEKNQIHVWLKINRQDVKLNYREVPFHKIYSNFMALGGDILNKDGTG